jgi:hypothetical protein
MLRVLGTIARSQFSGQLQSEQRDLANWAGEIHSGMYSHLVRPAAPITWQTSANNFILQRSSGLFGNYADDSSTFDDAASTALLASTVYRLALLKSVHTFVPKAEQSRKALFAAATNGSGLAHFTSDGWLTPVVNPNNVGQEGSQSPEGQAFVVQLSAAYKDWLDAGSPGANAATHLGAGLMRWWVVGLAVLVGTALL